eukprot:m.440565 g.440565  ORF g.440565 m.440565 type:complete len:52 (-) comp18536_c0_seq1:793-948(-)
MLLDENFQGCAFNEMDDVRRQGRFPTANYLVTIDVLDTLCPWGSSEISSSN